MRRRTQTWVSVSTLGVAVGGGESLAVPVGLGGGTRSRCDSWCRSYARCWSRRRCWTGFGAVPSSGVEIGNVGSPAPDNHLASRPDSGLKVSGIRRVHGSRDGPSICVRIISAASVQKGDIAEATRCDHFVAGPYCCVEISGVRHVGGTGGRPTVHIWIVSSACIHSTNRLLRPAQTIISLPVETAVWDSRASGALLRAVGIQLSVTGLYLPPEFRKKGPGTSSAPYNHFVVDPDHPMRISGFRRVSRARCRPAIRVWVVSATGVEIFRCAPPPTPDDHLSAGPECRVQASSIRRINSVRSRPAVCHGIVSATAIKITAIISEPHDSSRYRSKLPSGQFGRRGHCPVFVAPAIRAWIVSAAAVQQAAIEATPDDSYFTASRYCSLIWSGHWAHRLRWCLSNHHQYSQPDTLISGKMISRGSGCNLFTCWASFHLFVCKRYRHWLS